MNNKNSDAINEFLQELGFEKNSHGFLTGMIDNVTYILIHDPLNGYALQYSFITKREAGCRTIPLGRDLTVDDLKKHLFTNRCS